MAIYALDATGQAELIRNGELSPLELLDAVITRIDLLNPILNAVITTLYDNARKTAQSDKYRDSPFFGVPLLLKDFLCETAGDPYYCGSTFLRDLDWRSARDSYLATRFREAGFNIIGKTALPEFAGGAITRSDAFGVTRNPWNLAHSPDGSSGGSAAAVASGMVAVAHANDGLGSIRGPAAACGLVGLKPSRGRMPVGPNWHAGMFGNVAEFVLTKSVRDMAAILDAVQGHVAGNLFTAPAPSRPYVDELAVRSRKFKIGLQINDPILDLAVHPDCVKAVEDAGKLLEAMGHDVDYAYPPQLDTDATGLGMSLRILGTTGANASLKDWSEKIGREVTEHDVEANTWATAKEGEGYSGVLVHQAYNRIANGACRVVEWWSDDDYDFLISPVRTQPPSKTDLFGDIETRAAFGFFTMPFSFSGQPALALPMHVNNDNLPIGIQIVADYEREDLLIQLAAQLETINPWEDRYPYGLADH